MFHVPVSLPGILIYSSFWQGSFNAFHKYDILGLIWNFLILSPLNECKNSFLMIIICHQASTLIPLIPESLHVWCLIFQYSEILPSLHFPIIFKNCSCSPSRTALKILFLILTIWTFTLFFFLILLILFFNPFFLILLILSHSMWKILGQGS